LCTSLITKICYATVSIDLGKILTSKYINAHVIAIIPDSFDNLSSYYSGADIPTNVVIETTKINNSKWIKNTL